MSARKTPILLRKSSLSGRVVALHGYTRKTVRGREVIDSGLNGKEDVTADFDALVLEELLDPDSPNIAEVLDGAAKAYVLKASEHEELRMFRERLVALIKRHNATGHGAA